MVHFSKDSIKIVRLFPGNPTIAPNTSTTDDTNTNNRFTPIAKYPSSKGWSYVIVRFNNERNGLHYYKTILHYMLRLVKSDGMRQYFVFHIVPAVLRHIAGPSYIILRVHETANATMNIFSIMEIVTNQFNLVCKGELHMDIVCDMTNILYFSKLFQEEYIPNSKRPHKNKTEYVPITMFYKTCKAHYSHAHSQPRSLEHSNAPSPPPLPSHTHAPCKPVAPAPASASAPAPAPASASAPGLRSSALALSLSPPPELSEQIVQIEQPLYASMQQDYSRHPPPMPKTLLAPHIFDPYYYDMYAQSPMQSPMYSPCLRA